jgi:hypothetical protein
VTAVWDDGLPQDVVRALNPFDHGPVWMAIRLDQVIHRAWCATCRVWVGPDRTGDEHALHLVEDDAVAHLHSHGARCRLCEACRPGGALQPAPDQDPTGGPW